MEQSAQLRLHAQHIGVDLDDAALSALLLYKAELLAWNRRVNLTAITNDEEVLVKHFVDSLACVRVVGRHGALVDIGSGGGFPGLPLSIVLPSLSVTLLEPSKKKAAFLLHMVGTLGLRNVCVKPFTISDFASSKFAGAGVERPFTVAITRALDVARFAADIQKLLSPHDGRLVLCRAASLPKTAPLLNSCFEIEREIVYELPANFGSRVLTILKVR